MQEASELTQELERLLYTSSTPGQLFTWLVPTDDVVDAVQFSQNAPASSEENGSLVRSIASSTDAFRIIRR